RLVVTVGVPGAVGARGVPLGARLPGLALPLRGVPPAAAVPACAALLLAGTRGALVRELTGLPGGFGFVHAGAVAAGCVGARVEPRTVRFVALPGVGVAVSGVGVVGACGPAAAV